MNNDTQDIFSTVFEKSSEETGVSVFTNSDLGLQMRTILNEDGSISVNLEDAARGFGFVDTSKFATSGEGYIRWNRIRKYLSELGFSPQVAKDAYIPESLFYILAMKANNERAQKFQKWIAIDVIPSIRKTGSYSHHTQKTHPTVNDCIKAATLMSDCDSEHIPYVAAILKQGGFNIPDAGTRQPAGQRPSESHTNPDFSTKNKQTNKTIVPDFGTDVLCAHAGQLRDMGENRNGWIILPNNDFKNFCADRTIPANAFRKWLYENGFILGHTENKSRSTKYTFVYRFNGVHTRVLKFSDNQCTDAERRPL